MKQGESTADRFLFGALEKVKKESKSTSFEKKTCWLLCKNDLCFDRP